MVQTAFRSVVLQVRTRDAAACRCGRWRATSAPRNRGHGLRAQLVPDSGKEFEPLELLREATNKFQITSVRSRRLKRPLSAPPYIRCRRDEWRGLPHLRHSPTAARPSHIKSTLVN